MKRRIAIIICLSVLFGITPLSNAATGSKPSLKLQCPGYREFYPDPDWLDYYLLFKPMALVKFSGKKLRINSFLDGKYVGNSTSTRKSLTGDWAFINLDVKVPKNYAKTNYEIKYTLVDDKKRSSTYTCEYRSNNSNAPTSSPRPTLSSSPSPTPTINAALPAGGRTYFGQAFYYKNECWFAKKFTNKSNSVSSAAEELATVISPEGTIMFNIRFDIPSMKPQSEMWIVSWMVSPYGCEKGIGRVADGKTELRKYFAISNLYTRRFLTEVRDIPSILSVIREPGKYPDTYIYKLRVKNNSIDRTLKDSNDSRIGFVFLDAAGTPVFASTGRIMGAVPPQGEATLTAWDFEISSIKDVPGSVSVVGSLVYELCKDYDCSY